MAWRRQEEQQPMPVRRSIAEKASWVNPVSGTEAEEVKIRRAEAADAEAICNFLKEFRDAQAKKRPDIIDGEEEILSLEEVQEALADESRLICVAINKEDRMVGQILCETEGEEDHKKLVIANVYVPEDSRRQTIGTQLYDEASAYAKENGCSSIELSCWSFDKEGIRFFENLGYRQLLVTMEKRFGD